MTYTHSTFARNIRAALLAVAATVSTIAAAAPAMPPTDAKPPAFAPLPADSIYNLPVQLTDQNGKSFRIGELRGQPMLISMFFTSCQFICPMLTDSLRDTADKLQPSERERLRVVMVTFDPARDSVAVLKRNAEAHALTGAQWTLARTDDTSTRKLAAVLNIQYKPLPDGDFNHTTALILIDAEGRIVGRTSKIGGTDPAFVKLVKVASQASLH